MRMFRVLRKCGVKKSSVKTIQEVAVYCKCRMPQLPGDHMIECTKCKEWFHIDTCVCAPPATHIDNSIAWFCFRCLWTFNSSLLLLQILFIYEGVQIKEKKSGVCVGGGGVQICVENLVPADLREEVQMFQRRSKLSSDISSEDPKNCFRGEPILWGPFLPWQAYNSYWAYIRITSTYKNFELKRGWLIIC